MRLARKLIFALVATMLLILSVNAMLTERRETALFDSDMRQDAGVLGAGLARAAARVWARDGELVALALVAEIGAAEGHVAVRWAWLDAIPLSSGKPVLTAGDLARLRAGFEVSHRIEASDDNAGFLTTYVPVDTPGPRRAVLQLTESLAAERTYVQISRRNTLLFSVVLLGVSISVISAIGIFFVGRPTQRLVAQTRRISAGQLDQPVLLRQHDELGELAGEINAMSESLAHAHERIRAEAGARVAAIEQLRHTERLATVGKLASGVAHELGTPLSVVAGRAKMVASGEAKGDQIAENARIISDQANRMTQIIRQLLDFARKRAPAKERIDLLAAARNALMLLRQFADKRGVTLTIDEAEPHCEAWVDVGQFQQVLTNLISNAIQACDRGGQVIVGMCTQPVKPPLDFGGPEQVRRCLYVKDTGHGMDPATAERIFEPFFTTKEVGQGTGLGLSVAHGIVHEHGGFIAVQTAPGEGSTFFVCVPLPESEIVSEANA